MTTARRWASEVGAWPGRALALLIAAAPAAASAHPEHCGQASYLTVTPAQATLELELSPGPAVAARLAAHIDQDGDQQISEAEAQAYAREALAGQSLRADGEALALAVTRVECPPAARLATGQDKIRVVLVASTAHLAPGKHRFTLENSHEPVPSSYMAHAFAGPQVAVSEQTRDPAQRRLAFRAVLPGREGRGAGAWALGAGALAGALSLAWGRRAGQGARSS